MMISFHLILSGLQSGSYASNKEKTEDLTKQGKGECEKQFTSVASSLSV